MGVGCQNDLIFPELLVGLAGGIFENGMTASGLTAILLTLYQELMAPRRYKLKVPLSNNSLHQMREFLGKFAQKNQLNKQALERLDAVAEEALHTLSDTDRNPDRGDQVLFLSIQKEGNAAKLEFIAAVNENNLEDRISSLGDHPEVVSMEKEVSLRMLRYIASSVHHQQYHDSDIITIKVDAS